MFITIKGFGYLIYFLMYLLSFIDLGWHLGLNKPNCLQIKPCNFTKKYDKCHNRIYFFEEWVVLV